MNNINLYEEFRLVERNEASVNRAWKGAHLLLFFLAFVFGSFCTFCFHMLMYLFDENCVLFPKLLSLTSMRHNVIYEFMPTRNDLTDLPVDFVSTQWVEKSTCALPTYVPLVSGIFGLVWTTMFLMYSTGTRTLTGLQRPWRVLTPVFVFSSAMSILCIYSSVMTHSGLEELCVKLGEITGTSTCTYAVNVVTLVYERRIRGVYQATRLTIVSAWLHTACWLCSALLALLRMLLVVDFQLVRVKVSLHANIDSLMERHERHLRTVSPDDLRMKDDRATTVDYLDELGDEMTVVLKKPSESTNSIEREISEPALVPTEQNRLIRARVAVKLPSDKRFIPYLLYDLLDKICSEDEQTDETGFNTPWTPPESPSPLDSNTTITDNKDTLKPSSLIIHEHALVEDTIEERENLVKEILNDILIKLEKHLLEVKMPNAFADMRQMVQSESSFLMTPEEPFPHFEPIPAAAPKEVKIHENKKKSNLKDASSQTKDLNKKVSKRVLISEVNSTISNDEDESTKADSQEKADDQEPKPGPSQEEKKPKPKPKEKLD